jgi:hypothetical protein
VRPAPRLTSAQLERLLDALVYEHVCEMMPFQHLREHEQRITVLLAAIGLPQPDALAIAQGYLTRAMARAVHDPRIHHDLEHVVVVDECPI